MKIKLRYNEIPLFSELDDDTLINTEQLANEFGINRETPRRWVRERGLPVIDLGPGIGFRFRVGCIRTWLIERGRSTRALRKAIAEQRHEGGRTNFSIDQPDVA